MALALKITRFGWRGCEKVSASADFSGRYLVSN
jgi:hypothetical protein